jgi:hypothetical protein
MNSDKQRWIDPGDHLPWLIPVPPDDDPQPQPTRKQLDLTDLLASQSN